MTYPMKTSKSMLKLDLPSACGAKTRHGTPCKRAPMLPSLRCSKHGGKTPIKHGQRSKYALILRHQVKELHKEMNQQEKELEKVIYIS